MTETPARYTLMREHRAGEERTSATTHQVMLRVDDVDGVLEAARDAGARGDETTRDWEYGERQAQVLDPFGHEWVLTQTMRDVDPADWGGSTVVPRR